MRSMKLNWAKLTMLGALAASAAAAMAQIDWRTYGGFNQRTGRNVPAALGSPGRSFLNWWRPNAADLAGNAYVIDNLATLINALPTQSTTVGVWGVPLTVGEEAENPFIPPSYVNADPATNPSYQYSATVASAVGPDPTIGSTSQTQWNFDIAAFGDPTSRNYALYVWIPIGSTIVGGVRTFPQRYFVYEINYGTGQRWVDVVDTYAAGTGWVRLGGGGRATTQLYNFNGTNPITVTLHNTVPRDRNGNLSDAPGTTLVYSDAAMAVPDFGSYMASPIVSEFGAGGPLATHVVAARNLTRTGLRNGQTVTNTIGQVQSLQFDSQTGVNNTRWSFEPLSQSEDTTNVDNTSAGATVGAGWVATLLPATFFGTNFHAQPITNNLATATDVRYAPTLEDGAYEVWAWLPGDSGGVTFGTAVTYEVLEGATATQFTVNQSTARGWVRIGTQRFSHSIANPLTVRVTNHSLNPDIGAVAYADSIRFVGAANLAITSTPVQADVLIRQVPAGPLVPTSVTFVAAENGRIYCLDSQGNGDGTTRCYWTYPSTPDPNNAGWTDPNQVAGEDGSGPIAEMPQSFNLSSALVQRINGQDYLFIGSSNGRVYCIDVAGRGDMNAALQIPGTTNRVWTFPDDYPFRRSRTALGPIDGSLVYDEVTPGDHRIFIPTTSGRMYSVDAVGTPAQ